MTTKYEILDPRTKLSAGAYWIGDPCYVLPDDEWDDALEQTNYFNLFPSKEAAASGKHDYNPGELQNGVFSRNGIPFAVSCTAHGDGEYLAEDTAHGTDNLCGVDAGMLAAIPLAMIDLQAVDKKYSQGLHGLGFICVIERPFTVRYDDGVIHFGPIVINTGDDAEPYRE